MLSNGPASFKVGLRELSAQSIMEANIVAATLTMKESVFCSNVMKELGLCTLFDSVPVYTDKTSALLAAGNQTYSSRMKCVVLRHFFIQGLVKEGKISIHCVNTKE